VKSIVGVACAQLEAGRAHKSIANVKMNTGRVCFFIQTSFQVKSQCEEFLIHSLTNLRSPPAFNGHWHVGCQEAKVQRLTKGTSRISLTEAWIVPIEN
jgi:hypothetical protein